MYAWKKCSIVHEYSTKKINMLHVCKITFSHSFLLQHKKCLKILIKHKTCTNPNSWTALLAGRRMVINGWSFALNTSANKVEGSTQHRSIFKFLKLLFYFFVCVDQKVLTHSHKRYLTAHYFLLQVMQGMTCVTLVVASLCSVYIDTWVSKRKKNFKIGM